MTTQEATLHQQGHRHFSAGRFENLAELVAEEAVFHVAGRGPLAGDYHGRDEVFSLFRRMGEATGGSLSFDDEGFLADEAEHRTLAITRFTGKRNGKALDVKMYEVCRWENGRIVEEWTTFDDQYAVDEFWS